MIKERILQIADFKGIAKENFVSKLGMTYGNFKGRSKMTPINSNAIADILSQYPDINLEWLISGFGEMFKKTGDNSKNGGTLKVTKPSSSPQLKNETSTVYDDPALNREGSIPFYESDAFGGPISVFNDSPEVPATYIYFPGFEDCSFALRASGDSMESLIHAGDILACKEIKNKEIISYGDTYLVVTAEHRLVKIVRRGKERGTVILRSANKEYDDIDLNIDDILSLYLIKGIIKKTQL